MEFNIVTIFPEMFGALDYGVVGRAKEAGLIKLSCWNPRDYADNAHRKVDDASYGGGPGMVMMVHPLRGAIAAARSLSANSQIIYLTPQGKSLNHDLVKDLSGKPSFILVAGRYEGIDERLLELEPGIEISIGDYVLSGGELAAMVLIDALARHIPGVVGDVNSVIDESFATGILDYPHYTRPELVEGLRIPEVLLGGDHQKIAFWRRKQALGRTWMRRPELLTKIELTAVDRMLLNEFIEELV